MTDFVHSDETKMLQALVGEWKTQGRTRVTDDIPSIEVDASDIYEWLPGKCALLHRVDAGMGRDNVEGAEIIGYDPAQGAYITRYYGTDGPNAYRAKFTEENGALVWTMESPVERFRGTFSEDGNEIDGHWEQLAEDGSWQPWMDITLTKTA